MPSLQRLVIDQQYASIGIKVTPAQLQIMTPRPSFELHQEMPELSIESQSASFSVNWRQVHSEMGLKPPLELAAQIRAKGIEGAADGTIEAVQDGNYLQKNELRSNRVAQLARQKSLEQANVEVNIKSIPEQSPQVEWNPGKLQITWESKQFNVEWDGNYLPEVSLESPYSVEIFLRNRPSIRISVEDVLMPSEAGQHVDKRM